MIRCIHKFWCAFPLVLFVVSSMTVWADTAGTNVVVAPGLLETSPPELPAHLSSAKAEIKLKVRVAEDGRVTQVTVLESSDERFNEHVKAAVRLYRFTAGTVDGRPSTMDVVFSALFGSSFGAFADTMSTKASEKTVEQAAGEPLDDNADVPVSTAPISTARVIGRVRQAASAQDLQGIELELERLKPSAVRDLTHKAIARRDDAIVEAVYQTESSAGGAFLFQELPAGTYRLRAGASDYKAQTIVLRVSEGATETLLVQLASKTPGAFRTVIRSERDRGDVSRFSLSRAELTGIPGTLGDPLRVVESLPGVGRTPFLGGSVLMRGGLPADTQVFIDDIPVSLIFHFGGFASVLGPEAVERINVFQGGYPARFGQAMSGVVDVQTRIPAQDRFGLNADIDLLDATFFFDGYVPLRKKTADARAASAYPRLGFSLGGRRSYFEFPFQAAISLLSIESFPVPSYQDYFGKLVYQPSRKHDVALTFLGAKDQFKVVGENEEVFGSAVISALTGAPPQDFETFLNRLLGSNFWRLSPSWTYRHSDAFKNTLRFYVGETTTGLLSNGVVTQAFGGYPLTPPASEINFGGRNELIYEPRKAARITAGIVGRGRTLQSSVGPPFVYPNDWCTVADRQAGACDVGSSGLTGFNIRGLEYSLEAYAEARLKFTRWLETTLGGRGGFMSRTYEDQTAQLFYKRTDANGETTFGGRQQSLYGWFDPRISLRADVSPYFTLKAAGGTFHQPPSEDADIYNTADRNSIGRVRAPYALHLIFGFESKLAEALSLNAQFYTIRRHGLTVDANRVWRTSQTPFSSIQVTQPSGYTSWGSGQTDGIEILLRRDPTAHVFGWLAYTFQSTTMNVGETIDPYHPAPFDSRHNLVLVAKGKLPFGLTLGGRFQLATGAPSPVYQNATVLHNLTTGFYLPVDNLVRKPRLPMYHRLDVRLDKTWSRKNSEITAFLEVLNVYNQVNAEVVGPSPDFRGRGITTLIPGIPIFPSLGVSAKF